MTTTRRIALWTAALVALATFPGGTRADPWTGSPLVVRVDPARPSVLERWNDEERRTRDFYETAGYLGDVAVAADDRHVAFLVANPGTTAGDVYARQPTSRLEILDSSGTVLHTVDDVWHFTWSPDGSEITYVTGSHHEGELGFAPDNCWLMDVDQGKRRMLAELGRAYDLHWLRTTAEDALYAKVLDDGLPAHVLRYDLESGTVSRPTSRAFHFSPDGEFYYFEPQEAIELGLCSAGRDDDTCLRVFSRRDDRPVPGLATRLHGRALGWVGGEGHSLLFANPKGTRSSVVEVVTGEETVAPEAALPPWQTARGPRLLAR